MRRGAKRVDRVPKRVGNAVGRMERELEKFRPIVVDNSLPDAQATAARLVKISLKGMTADTVARKRNAKKQGKGKSFLQTSQ